MAGKGDTGGRRHNWASIARNPFQIKEGGRFAVVEKNNSITRRLCEILSGTFLLHIKKRLSIRTELS